MVIRIAIMLCSFILVCKAAFADECQDKFVQCISDNQLLPDECQSVLLSCSQTVTIDDLNDGIQETILSDRDGDQKYMEVEFKNISQKPIKLGFRSIQTTCTFGPMDAVFSIGITLQPGESVVRQSGHLCLGDGGKVVDTAVTNDDKLVVNCYSENQKSVTIFTERQNVFRFTRSDKTSGTFSRSNVDEVFLQSLCRYPKPPETDILDRLLDGLKRLTIDKGKNSEQTINLEYGNATTGVRN